ncbi:MAG: sugar-binding protein [Bacteroidales bacterium]
MKKAMFTLLVAVATAAWVGANTTTPTNPLVISHAKGAINIDGVGDEATWTSISEVVPAIAKTAGAANFGGWFKLTYDDDYIYVLVSVNDPTPNHDGSSTWQSDCVELFFAMDKNTHSSYQSGDWEIRKIASKSQADGGVDGSANVATVLLADENFKVEQVDGANGYVQEWQLPINTLKQDAAFDGQNIRFDIQLADNDGTGHERTAQRFWNSNADNQWNQTTNMGYVRFSSDLIPDVDTCTLYKDSLNLLKTNIQSLQQQIILLQAENIILRDSIGKTLQTLSQAESDRNTIVDSLLVLYNMLVNNQSITLLSFSEVTTSVATRLGNVDLHLYPNPAHDRMIVECSENILSYSIYSITGKAITTATFPSSSQSPYEIRLPVLSPGLYNLYLQTSKGTIAALFQKN